MEHQNKGKIEMKYSDEILSRSQERGLTKHERHELVESYKHEQAEDNKTRGQLARSVKEFKDTQTDLPRNRTNCPSFKECPIDFKCINYDSRFVACHNCTLHETDDICQKPNLHNEKTFSMMITRERIELNEYKD
jgi:hypothetical protein